MNERTEKNRDCKAANDGDYYQGRVCPARWFACVMLLSLILVFLVSTVVCVFSAHGW